MIKKLVPYISVFVVCSLASFAYFAFIVENKYSSTAVVYPTSTLNPQFLLEAGLRFGDEKELNELIEVLNSNDVAIKVLSLMHKEKFADLSQKEITHQIKLLANNTVIDRGVNRSVNITVFHNNADTAALIANNYSEAAYAHLSELVIQSVEVHLNAMSDLYEKKLLEVSLLQDTIEKLEALGESKVEGMVQVKTPRYRFFDTQFEFEMKKLSELKSHKEHLQGIIKKNIPQLFVVSEARSNGEISQKSNFMKAAIFALFSVLFLFVLRNRKRFFNLAH